MPNAQDILNHIKSSLDGIINPFSNPFAPTPAGLSPDIECALQGKIWKGYDAQGNGICEPVPSPTILPDTPKTNTDIPTISLPPIRIYDDQPTPIIIYYPDPAPIPPLPPRRLPATPDASTKGGSGTTTEPGKSISVRVSLKDQTYGSLLHEPISDSPVELNYYSSTAFIGNIKAEQEEASSKFLNWLEGTLPEADDILTNTAMALFVRKVVTPKLATLNTGAIFGMQGITNFIADFINRNVISTLINCRVPVFYTFSNYSSRSGYGSSFVAPEYFKNLQLKDLSPNSSTDLSEVKAGITANAVRLIALRDKVEDDVIPLITYTNDNVHITRNLISDLQESGLETVVNRLISLSQVLTSSGGATGGDNTALLLQLYDNVTTLTNNLAFLRKVGLDSINNRIIAVSQVLAGLSAQVDADVVPLLTQLYDNVTTVNANITAIAGDVNRIDDTTLVTGNRLTGLAQIISGAGATGDDNTALLLQLYDNLTALTNDLAFLRKVGLDSISNRVVAIAQVLAGLSAQVDTDVLPLLTQLYDNVTTVNNSVNAIAGDITRIDDTTLVTGNRLTGLAQIISSPSTAEDNSVLLTQLYNLALTTSNNIDELGNIGLETLVNRLVTLSQIVGKGSDVGNSALLTQLYDLVLTTSNNVDELGSIGLETLVNRLVTLSQIVSKGDRADNAALLTQLHDLVLSTSNNVDELGSIGLETLVNRLVTLSQIVRSGGDRADNTALLTQLYNLMLTTNNNVETLNSIGLETLVNRLVTLSQIVSKGSNSADNTALLEQVFNLVLATHNNVNTLSGIGLETLVNRLITLSDIVRSEVSSNNSALLEQLFNLALSTNNNVTKLTEIGLETVVNRLITLSQLLINLFNSSNSSGLPTTSTELAQRLGFEDFPITLPQTLIASVDAQGNPVVVPNETIESIPQLMIWHIKRMDELFGQWGIELEIKDTDPTTPGNQEQKIRLPNMAEATAEMFMLCFQTMINSETLLNFALRTLVETGQDKQQNFITYKLLLSMVDWAGFKTKDVAVDLPMTFDPGKTNFDEVLQETNVKVSVSEFDEKFGLEAKLMRFSKAAAILDGLYFKKVNPFGDVGKQILDSMKNSLSTVKKVNDNEDDNFEQFLNDVEDGFKNVAGISDSDRPYGRDYAQRPKIKDLTNPPDPNPQP